MKQSIYAVFVVLWIGNTFADIDKVGQKEHLWAEAESKQHIFERVRRANTELTENQKQFDVGYYKLDLFPDADAKILYGNVTMRAQALTTLNSAQLNFLNNMVIDSVLADNRPAVFSHRDDLLTVQLDREYGEGEWFETRVVYHGLPASSGFGAFGFSSYAGKPMIWTLSEPFGARNWWPCKDAPIDKADSVDIRVKVNADLIVASNGRLASVEAEGKYKIYNWQERYPIVTYLVSLAIHPYVTYSDWYITDDDSMEVQFYVFADHLKQLRADYAKTVPMIHTLSKLFGEYPFIKEKYGHAEFLWGGGMEHQTITSLGGWSESLIVHELAHQWWGDMITCETFHDIWLNEGFATYTEALWWEQKYGVQALHQDMAGNVYLGDETIYVENPLTDNVFFYPTTYAKASWVLHMLRHVIGDDVFFHLLRRYYDEFKFKTITTDQFRDLCERVSGQDLKAFFLQWIYGRGAPFYSYLWESAPSADGKGYDVGVAISQMQTTGTIFQMPIDLTIITAAGERTITVENSADKQFYKIHVDDQPTSVILDRDNWILKRVETIVTPQISLQSFQITDDAGVALERLPKGAQINLSVELLNIGTRAEDVSLQLVSMNEHVKVLDGEHSIGEMRLGESAANVQEPFRLDIMSEAQSTLTELQLLVSYSGGALSPLTLLIPLGAPTLLIVDDDDGGAFERFYQNLAVQLRINSETWSVKDRDVPTAELLNAHRHTLWFTGDDRSSTLTTTEQEVVHNFLKNGGKLLLTGRHIGADLVRNGSPSDAEFYERVLHAEFVGDQNVNYAAIGVQTDPVGKLLAVRFAGVSANSEITPVHDAVPVMNYMPTNLTAALRRYDPATDGRLVYVAFGLEEIVGPKESSAALIVANALAWFDTVISDISDDLGTLPDTFVLWQNAPNPFNPSTTAQYSIPETAYIEGTIHNVLGEKVRQFTVSRKTAGRHSFEWDGLTDGGDIAASGVYFLTVSAKSENKSVVKTVKMLKIN